MELRDLGARIGGDVVLPGDETWDAARQAWNLAVDQRPIGVVYPESSGDVARTVRFAAERGLRIAFNAGGHNAGPIDWSRDTLLLKTERMRGIEIDVAARRARIEAGVLGKPLAGGRPRTASPTSPEHRRTSGVVGYSLGGGLSWMVRTLRARLQQHRCGRGRHGGRPAGSTPTATPSPTCSGRSAAGAATSRR